MNNRFLAEEFRYEKCFLYKSDMTLITEKSFYFPDTGWRDED